MNRRIESEARIIKKKQADWLESQSYFDLLEDEAKRGTSNKLITQAISEIFAEDIHKIITEKMK